MSHSRAWPRAARQNAETDRKSGPFANLVDFVEPLQWLPNRTHARAERLHGDFIEVYGAMVVAVKARMNAGEDVPHCLAKVLIEGQQQEKLDWEDMCMLSAAFAIGGVHSVRRFYFRIRKTIGG